jgi:F420-dependent oxidoreductase-like protein
VTAPQPGADVGGEGLLFGYHMPSQTFPGVRTAGLFDRIVANAQAAEEAGFDLVTVMDHFHQIPPVGEADEPMLESSTLLGALAARTRRVRLGTMVTGVTYRNPALVAKAVTTLDVVSGGRAVCGLGAAWYEEEHAAYGFIFPPVRERMDRLDEALRICRLMFTEDRPSFAGRYYRLQGALNRPRPVQPGGPPILVGGSGERRTLRLVARYADLSNWFGSLEELAHKSEVLNRYCEEEGRDPGEITRTVLLTAVVAETSTDAARILDRLPLERRGQAIVGTADAVAERLAPYVDLGFRGFTLRNAGLPDPEAIARAGEVIGLMRGAAPVRLAEV